MDRNFLDKLESFWSKIKELGVWEHICKIKNMLFHPRLFWREYDQLPLNDKLIQFLTYAALFALTIWSVTDNMSEIDIIKKIPLEVFGLFVYMIIIALANMIVCKEWKNIWFFVVFCCYTKFICLIPQLLAIKAYIETETPIWMGLAVFILLLSELMVLLYPVYVRQSTRKNMVLAVLLTIVLLNAYDSFYIITDIPRASNDNYINVIARERYELGKSIKNAYEIPTYVVSRDYISDEFLYSNPTDSVASLKYDDREIYFAELSEDMDSLKAVSARSQFRTNKSFFDDMYELKRNIKYVYDTKMYEKNPVIDQKDISLDSINSYRIYYREYNKDVEEANNKLLERDIKEAEQFNKIISIYYIGALWHPVSFIWNAKNNNT